uniref:NADH-ubiquinone oxidoreductase chain 3 n=1 Tax=Eupelmus anpingensis TaxID=2989843 RepID=A0A9E7V2Y5_9HYME|nr:NADH dehydrogenase subunit 3 [Eupelmus anpingensis]UYR45776.1 NADH dehydrogenase subunit 3 [Eupelmus anpingensis]
MMLILFLMILLNFVISLKIAKNREKISPFECGFDSMSMNRLPFSLQFYLISIIFLIFDVEISLILPIMEVSFFLEEMILMFITSIILIIFILIIGLFLEWKEGALKWFK